ncbi:hypothetical protein EK21DRAFT_116243 [Setomelanomma holmii]|uniref:2EXR domain-containing protein n=1 Tax=Setomelanomma holmii TaxID=210430 RepID=A0A9P4LGT7_9PLEO|nr:hypothetical protein EK21DRAFT_116243 [Setomelanomma holmii]
MQTNRASEQAYRATVQLPSFLDLPAELRNAIYNLVIEHRVINVHAKRSKYPPHSAASNRSAILHVNRQMHSESVLLLYFKTTFAFTCKDDTLAVLDHQVLEHIQAIRSIQLSIFNGMKMFGDMYGKRIRSLTHEVFQSLERMPGLTGIELVEMSRSPPTDHMLGNNLEVLSRNISTWRPEIQITARHPDGKWIVAL